MNMYKFWWWWWWIFIIRWWIFIIRWWIFITCIRGQVLVGFWQYSWICMYFDDGDEYSSSDDEYLWTELEVRYWLVFGSTHEYVCILMMAMNIHHQVMNIHHRMNLFRTDLEAWWTDLEATHWLVGCWQYSCVWDGDDDECSSSDDEY